MNFIKLFLYMIICQQYETSYNIINIPIIPKLVTFKYANIHIMINLYLYEINISGST